MGSAYEHQEVVSDYIANEREHGRVLGPLCRGSGPPIHTSSFGVIPKRHQCNKWRLIIDLSSPRGRSVNDGIDRSMSSLAYISVADIASAILSLGPGSLLAKSDVKHAYRQIPVHPDDRPLLGMRWQGQLFCDATLPFGLRSAPLIFTAVADAVLRSKGASNVFHYVDDFVFIGPPGTDKCRADLQLFKDTCSDLGMLIAEDKTEGPATCLTVLGIEIDTLAMELRLPADKLARLSDTLQGWRGRRAGSHRDLESLVGLLQHSTQVVRPGRVFLRRLYNLLARTASFKPHYSVRLNSEAQADVEWWCTFLHTWNGTSMLRPLRAGNPDVEIWSDASGNWGCGALWHQRWLQLQWVGLPIASESIAAKELFPVVVAAAVWGREWRGATVCVHCDNQSVVDILNNQSAREPLLCHQLRSLFFVCARFDCDIVARHTPGVANVAADTISRNNLHSFRLQVPDAAPTPVPVPPDLVWGLSSSAPAWRSQDWSAWLNSSLDRR